MNKQLTTDNTSSAVLRLEGVEKTYGRGASKLTIFKNASMQLDFGEIIALVAPSGSGKSTLLHIAGLLERPTAGEIYIGEKPCHKLNDAEHTELRRTNIGFVYQFHHLLPEFSALENIALPQMIRGIKKKQALEYAMQLLQAVQVDHRADHRPAELSGGEQQRVAIARAVANTPRILLADEPTGNLDPKTSSHVFEALLNLAKASGLSAIIATHNLELAAKMDRQITINEQKITVY